MTLPVNTLCQLCANRVKKDSTMFKMHTYIFTAYGFNSSQSHKLQV